jgi:adenosylmethionine-8-amino-7-oxononanoate aminotransferase
MLPGELAADDRIRQIGMQGGLLIYMRRTNGGQFGGWFLVVPPLTISLTQIDDMMDRLERTLERYAAEVRRAGAIR